jgi:Skp family chaperone for outer membrane proteins
MRNDLKQVLRKEENKLKHFIDSLDLIKINIEKINLPLEKKYEQKELIENLQKEKLTAYQELIKKMNSSVKNRIFEGINEFAKKEDIKLILNSSFDEGILYSEESIDITSKFVVYLNLKYNDKLVK